MRLGLPRTGVCWVVSLYVSWAIQNGGLGRSAMRRIESLAAEPPLSAEVMVLDTAAKQWQLNESVADLLYEGRGLSRPAVSTYAYVNRQRAASREVTDARVPGEQVLKASEDWYERQGYEVFRREEVGYAWISPAGDIVNVPLVYLKKSLSP